MSVSLQKSIVENSEELQDYLRDLKNWERDIKKEDMKLSEKSYSLSSEELPAVRKKSTKLTTAANKKSDEVPEKRERKTNKISAYDYAAWDKFDVDKALESEEETDQEDKQNDIRIENTEKPLQDTNSRPVEQVSNSVSENNVKRAEKLKEEGNLCYSSGRLKDAIGKYTQGIALNPLSPLLPANRAMAYIKLKKFKAAEKDCTKALQLDPNYIKAYLRRATARVAISNADGAAQDYEQVLELEPWNNDAKRELEKLKNVGKSNANSTPEEKTEVEASSKMKKLKVEVIDSKKSDEDLKINTREIRPKPLVRVPIIDVSSREEVESHIASKETKENILSVITPVNKENIPTKDLPSKIDLKTPCNEFSSTTEEIKSTIPSLPKPPKTSHQFSQDWRRIYKHKDLAETYLKSIPSTFYPKIEIEVDQLVEIVLTLCDENFDASLAASIMAAVIKSRGFFLNLSFLENDQKQAFQNLIAKIETCEEVKYEVKQLKDSL